MATSVSSVSEALNSLVTESLNAINLGGKTSWQQTGGTGGQIVYPQGSSDNVYYYPTFSAFDKQVTGNTSSGFNLSKGTLTSQLASLYQTFGYGLSAQQQAADAQAAAAVASSINSFFTGTNGWAETFLGKWNGTTVETEYTQAAAYSTLSWYQQALSAWKQYNNDGTLPVDANGIFGYIQNSLWWQVNTAFQNKASVPTITKTYSTDSKTQLYDALVSAGFEFSKMFNPQVNNDYTTPWNDSLYAEYNSLLYQVKASTSTQVAAQYNNLVIEGALTYLQAYTGNTSQDLLALTANTAAYAPVFSGTNDTPNPAYPLYLPVASYALDPTTIAGYAEGTDGDSFAFTITQSQTSDTTFTSSESAAGSYSQDEYSNWGFMSESEKSSGGAGESTSFADYDANASTSSGTITFNGIGYQSWTPSSQSANLWLLSDQIADAIGAVTSTTPYLLSPNFQGGYGWSDSTDAANYASAGFAYIESIAYSFNPITVVTGASTQDAGSYWSESEYANQSESENSGFGLGDWMGGGESENESTQESESSSSSSWNSQKNEFTVTSNPIAQPVSSSSYGGYPALQIGASIEVVAQPNQNTTAEVSGMHAKGASNLIDTKWIVLESASTVRSNNDDNIIFGSNEADLMHASRGSDEIYGHEGNDKLIGGGGHDFLSGGSGKNYIKLGSGKDYIEFNNMLLIDNLSLDRISDFSVKQDVLWFTNHVNSSLVSVEGNKLLYDGEKFAVFEGLNENQLERVLRNAAFI